jgi:hypothetical protein
MQEHEKGLKMKKIRERLADAIESQGGYSTRYDSFALEYCVGLYHVSSDMKDLLPLARSIQGEDFELFALPDTDELDRFFTQAQETLADSLQDTDISSYREYGKSISIRHGLTYTNWPRKFSKEKPNKDSWASRGGHFITNLADNSFTASYGLYGRGGKHLCVEEFEGKSLKVSNETLADRLRDDSECEYHGYSNQWCRKLLAAMDLWSFEFTSKKASEEMQEQIAWELVSWSEWQEAGAKDEALIP